MTATPSVEEKLLEKTLLANVKEQKIARRWGIFFKILFFGYIFFMTYLVLSQQHVATPYKEDHVALLDLNGSIGQGGEIDADEVVTGLRRAFETDKVTGVILRINSPGGSAVQSNFIYNEIKRLREIYPEKKLYAVVMDMCASGGYYIASAADEIYASPASLVGSIGVVFFNFGFSEAMDKIGVEQRTITAGKNKFMLDPFSPSNPDHVKHAKNMIDNVHQQFITAVKNGRKDRLKDNSEIFSGLYWSGEQALELGLVDGMGSASYVAREILKNENIVDYTVSKNLIDKISERMGSKIFNSFKSAVVMGSAGIN